MTDVSDMTEHRWDRKLKITTVGREDSHEDVYHYPYEPTPYSVLERLAESEYLHKDSCVVDYGCGKGRVGFFLNYRIGCRVAGVEFDEDIYRIALQNQTKYTRKDAVEFLHSSAENYIVQDADSFYFFNPFSVEILRSVIGKIMDSYYEDPRPMHLFFYYPNEDYVAYLMTCPELMFLDEIDCRDLFPGDNARERILIFEVG